MKRMLFLSMLAVGGLAHADDPAQLYKSSCSTCHGADGKGDTNAGKKAGVKDLTATATWDGLTDDAIAKQIREGKKGDDGKMKMPANKKLTDDQITQVIAFVKTFKKSP